jgi:pimeloyl-ACP methyl ester carboxylesterase
MAKTKRLIKNFVRLLLPICLLLVLALVGSSVWLVYVSSHPRSSVYLVTPAKYGQLSARASQVTEETWTNPDGTPARGWLLRGIDNGPGIILLHKYGADRSYTLNLGVKLSEATNFTILMPDQRGHGQDPPVKYTSFGNQEADDVTTAIKFLQNLKSPSQGQLVGKDIGIYGVEMGAIVAISAAARDTNVKALALDSVPRNPDAVLAKAIRTRFPFASDVTAGIAQLGTPLYFFDGSYRTSTTCDQVRSLTGRKVLLLGGLDAPDFRSSTQELSKCLPAAIGAETKTDLSPSGYSITDASIDQADAYDQKIIDFFRQSFMNG